MSRIKVKDFQTIDFTTFDFQADELEMPDGKVFRFSEHICHFCWNGGTVLENIDNKEELFCVSCQNRLQWYRFQNDFLEPTGDEIEFLLPMEWSPERVNEWYEAYKIRRIEEEKTRERILKEGKE